MASRGAHDPLSCVAHLGASEHSEHGKAASGKKQQQHGQLRSVACGSDASTTCGLEMHVVSTDKKRPHRMPVCLHVGQDAQTALPGFLLLCVHRAAMVCGAMHARVHGCACISC